jgi:thiol-disulfide isomerase/thioredoxin
MKWVLHLLVLAFVFGLLGAPNAIAQEKDTADQIKKLEETQTQLQQEVAALKEEMAKLTSQLQALSKQLLAVQAAQKKPAKRERPANQLLGKPAPVVSVTSQDGGAFQLGGKHDKPQVLFFYASWCGFSKRAIPGINTLHEKYKDKGVDVIAVSMDGRSGKRGRTEEQIVEQYNELELTLPLVMDPERKAGEPYKAMSFPTLFVVGASGEVEAVHIGAKPKLEETVGQQLDLLLEGKTRKDFPK